MKKKAVKTVLGLKQRGRRKRVVERPRSRSMRQHVGWKGGLVDIEWGNARSMDREEKTGACLQQCLQNADFGGPRRGKRRSAHKNALMQGRFDCAGRKRERGAIKGKHSAHLGEEILSQSSSTQKGQGRLCRTFRGNNQALKGCGSSYCRIDLKWVS